MSATGVNLNWSPVAFNSITLNKITQGTFNQGGKLTPFSGDNDFYPTVMANTMNDPSASFTSANVGIFMGIAPGTTSTLTATLNDARAQTGGGVNFVLINAMFQDANTSASHAQYATVTGNWLAYSSDGQTSPLSFTRS